METCWHILATLIGVIAILAIAALICAFYRIERLVRLLHLARRGPVVERDPTGRPLKERL
jgi:hypothetical protein